MVLQSSCQKQTIFIQQQILQRKRGGAHIYFSDIGDYSLCIPFRMYPKIDHITNDVIKDGLQLQFPSNKNVTKYSTIFKTVQNKRLNICVLENKELCISP